MKRHAWIALSWALAAINAAAQSPDAAAGKAKAEAVCAACHGVNGISVSDTIPNLAGQRAAYLENQLKALRDGVRKAPVMNALAGQLKPDEIANLAAHFASLPAAASTAKSDFMPALAHTRVAFPDRAQGGYTLYQTINFPETRQVRLYFANARAMQSARDGKPLPDGAVLYAEVYAARLDAAGKPVAGADGLFQPDRLLFYTAMQRDAGWGRDIPEMLRNEDWNYAVFTTARQLRPGVNQAECLACHKPLDKQSYTFTLDKLTAVAQGR
jgi:cytochrome c553